MTRRRPKFVFDTSTLISAILRRSSSPAQPYVALTSGDVLTSIAASRELLDVATRPKFDRYVPRFTRLVALESLLAQMVPITVASLLHVCVDPKDDHVLALALDGKADFLVTGDDHLLRLHPFRSVQIVTSAEFLYPMEQD